MANKHPPKRKFVKKTAEELRAWINSCENHLIIEPSVKRPRMSKLNDFLNKTVKTSVPGKLKLIGLVD